MEDGGGFQQDFRAHLKFDDGIVDSTTLATVDLNDYYRWDPTWEYAASTDPTLVAWGATGSWSRGHARTRFL